MNLQARKQLPSWLLPVVVGIGLLVLGFVVWKAMTGASAPTGPSTQVHAGMIDFHKEARKGNVGSERVEADEDDKNEKKTGSSTPGSPKGKSTEPDGDNDGDGDKEKTTRSSSAK